MSEQTHTNPEAIEPVDELNNLIDTWLAGQPVVTNPANPADLPYQTAAIAFSTLRQHAHDIGCPPKAHLESIRITRTLPTDGRPVRYSIFDPYAPQIRNLDLKNMQWDIGGTPQRQAEPTANQGAPNDQNLPVQDIEYYVKALKEGKQAQEDDLLIGNRLVKDGSVQALIGRVLGRRWAKP